MREFNKIIGSIIVVFILTITFSVNASTIKETTNNKDNFDTIADGTFVIGITKFSPDTVITAIRATKATFNDVMFNIGKEDYNGVGVYYYTSGYWFMFDEQNNVTNINTSNPLYEKLSNSSIYYVNNIEKIVHVPISLTPTIANSEFVFRANNNKQVDYEKGVLLIPATVSTIDIYEKRSNNAEIKIGSLKKDETNESFVYNIPKPEINFGMGDDNFARGLLIDNEDAYCAGECNGTETDEYIVDGYVIYEKNGSNYSIIKTVNGVYSDDSFIANGLDEAENKIYVIRMFINNNGGMIYSDYSNELVVYADSEASACYLHDNDYYWGHYRGAEGYNKIDTKDSHYTCYGNYDSFNGKYVRSDTMKIDLYELSNNQVFVRITNSENESFTTIVAISNGEIFFNDNSATYTITRNGFNIDLVVNGESDFSSGEYEIVGAYPMAKYYEDNFFADSSYLSDTKYSVIATATIPNIGLADKTMTMYMFKVSANEVEVVFVWSEGARLARRFTINNDSSLSAWWNQEQTEEQMHIDFNQTNTKFTVIEYDYNGDIDDESYYSGTYTFVEAATMEKLINNLESLAN